MLLCRLADVHHPRNVRVLSSWPSLTTKTGIKHFATAQNDCPLERRLCLTSTVHHLRLICVHSSPHLSSFQGFPLSTHVQTRPCDHTGHVNARVHTHSLTQNTHRHDREMNKDRGNRAEQEADDGTVLVLILAELNWLAKREQT